MPERAVDTFLDHFGIRPRKPDRDLLHELGQSFARLPYENITKLIKKHRVPPGDKRRRLPREVVADHLALGAGGTCFALTRLFGEVLARLGYRCYPVLCDTRHQAAGHCALIVESDGPPLLVDPGYLLHDPVVLDGSAGNGGPSPIQIASSDDGRRFQLSTYGIPRHAFTRAPTPANAFLAAWDASFEWTMMNDVHVCASSPGGYAYVHGRKLRTRAQDSKETLDIRGNETDALARRFGIDSGVIEQAYALVDQTRSR